MTLTVSQLRLLSQFFLDLAKGILLTTFAIPFLPSVPDTFTLFKALFSGIMSLYLALYIKKLEEYF